MFTSFIKLSFVFYWCQVVSRELASSQHNLYDVYTYCCVYSVRLLMMERETVRNM